jgi:hypothetical protein
MIMGSSEVEMQEFSIVVSLTKLIVVFSSQESVRDSGRAISKVRFHSESIPLSRMESVREEMDQSSKSQMAGSSSHISTDPHVHYKEHEVNDNVDVKSGSEK